jgi:hypothetical protein
MADELLENILSGFESLSAMLERFVTAHEKDPVAREMLFAMMRAKDSTDQAAVLIRQRLKQ